MTGSLWARASECSCELDLSGLPEYLQECFSGLSLSEAADQTGIAASTLGRIVRGLVRPSFENVLRLAWSLRVHPAELHELDDNLEVAFLYRRLFPEAKDKPRLSERDLYLANEIGFHERVQRLLELGLSRPLDESLKRLESALEVLRPVFERTARMVRAKAAVLIVDYPKRPGEVLFRWECSQPRAQALAENRELKGWTAFAYQDSGLTLTLFLREPEARINAEMIHGALQMWVTGIAGLSSMG